MKTNILTLSVLLLAVSACGTANQLASSGQRFEDGIYYTPSEDELITTSDQEVQNLVAETSASEIYRVRDLGDTVVISSENPVTIVTAPDIDIWMGYTPYSWAYSSWNYWYYSPWRYDPWYYSSWYYSPWHYDPWYYSSWYYDPWYYDRWYGYSYPVVLRFMVLFRTVLAPSLPSILVS